MRRKYQEQFRSLQAGKGMGPIIQLADTRKVSEQDDDQLLPPSELEFSTIKIQNVEAQNEFLSDHSPQTF